MGHHALKVDETETEHAIAVPPTVRATVTIETVRSASRKVGPTIENLTDKISQEVGAEADKAIAEE
ncbi:MAG TPA: hypothetical protein VII40_21080 [Xanthobacteraceae bacterium]|jgi:hypothetical protein